LDVTGGKCDYVTVATFPIVAGYPLTSKTLPAREAYINRWGTIPGWRAAQCYDTLRFILPDSIERAGTIETEAVIKALEEAIIETTSAKNFVFTSSHDLMMGENPNNPDADYQLVMYFQWQDGEMVPVYPEKIMEEAGATYMFPDWPGPWDEIS
jgi:branched-chain amino acid transport system substrate-binding protein